MTAFVKDISNDATPSYVPTRIRKCTTRLLVETCLLALEDRRARTENKIAKEQLPVYS